MKTGFWTALAPAVLLIGSMPGLAGRGLDGRSPFVRLSHFVGSDPGKWHSETVTRREASQGGAQFVTAGAKLAWSVYVGDQNETSVRKVAVDAAGNTYVVGRRRFTSAVSPGALAETYDVLVAKVDAAGNRVYTTYLGGKGLDDGIGIAADLAGSVYVVGHTTSPNFPLRNALQAAPAGGFIAKLDPEGLLVYSTYFGGSPDDSVNAVAVDESGDAYVTGETYSSHLPTTPGAYQRSGYVSTAVPPIASTSFVGKLGPSGTLVFLSYLGGSPAGCTSGSHCLDVRQYDRGLAIAVEFTGDAFIEGVSNKVFPTTPGAPQAVHGPFIVKLSATGAALIYSTGLGGSFYGLYRDVEYDRPTGIAVDSTGNAYVTGITASPSFPTTPGALQQTFGGPLNPDPSEAPPFDAFLSKISPAGTAFAYSTYLGGPGQDYANGIAVSADGNAFVVGTSEALNVPADPTLPGGSGFVVEFDPTASALLYTARLPKGSAEADVALAGSGKLQLAGLEGMVSSIDLGGGPAPAILAVSNSAATRVSGLVAPGELVSIWGQAIGPSSPAGTVVSSGFVATTIADTQVFFDDIPAPLLYVSDKQINAAVPYAVAGGLLTKVRVVHQGVSTRELRLGVTGDLPEIFRNPDGAAAALNEDGSINSAANPARPGSIIVVFGTGAGELSPPGLDGSVINPPTLIPDLRAPNLEVLYAGAAPDLISGVFQVNVRLPQEPLLTVGGRFLIQVTKGTYISEPAYVYVSR